MTAHPSAVNATFEITEDWPDGTPCPPDGPNWWSKVGHRCGGLTAWVMVEPPPPGTPIFDSNTGELKRYA
jgi:hypothetical protein